jgi:hypothetical protein
VYGWLRQYTEFAETYQIARELMARSLLDELLDEVKAATPDKSLLLKTKGAILQWAIARFNPREFSDSRRIELKGEVNHRHTHELAEEQKKRIAEAWLMSRSIEAPAIEAETTGPDLPAQIAKEEQREQPPKRKAPVQQQKKSLENDDW